MKRSLPWLFLVLACRSAGLGGPLLPAPRSAEEVRAEAAQAEPARAAELLWLEAQDRTAALAGLDAALLQTPQDAGLHLRRALLRLENLDAGAALEDLLVLTADPTTPESEAALVLLEQHASQFHRQRSQLESALAPYLTTKRGTSASRVAEATLILAQLKHLDRSFGEEQGDLDRGGWLTACRGVGPIAPLADVSLAEPSRYELGQSSWAPTDRFRGFLPPIRTLGHEAGGLLYTNGDRPGLYVLECYFEVAGTQPRSVILETRFDGSGRVAIDGQSAVVRELSRARGARLTRVRLRLAPGWHRLTAALLGGPEARPRFSILGAQGARVVRESRPDSPGPMVHPAALPEIGQEGDGPGSLATWIDGLVADPEHALYGRLLGALIYGSRSYRDLDRARALLSPAIESQLHSAALLSAWARLLGSADLSRGQAEATLREAARLDPEGPALLLALAEASLGDAPERSLEVLAKLRAIAPKAAPVAALEMRAYRAKGWNVEAAQSLKRAAQLGAPPAFLLEGAEFLRSLERNAEAELLEQQALVEDPLEAHARRAERALRRGDLDEAIRAHEEAANDPDGLYHRLRVAELELARHHHPAAIAAARRSLELDPLSARAWRFLMMAAVAAQDRALAEEGRDALRALGEMDLPGEILAGTLLGGGPSEPVLPPALQAKLAFDPVPELRYLPGTTTPKGLDPADRWSRHKAVQLLDRVIDVVRGSQTLSYRHSVLRLQTKEATDLAGELNLPPEALALELQTLKPDGRKLGVDRHNGKEDLSFSALAPGDGVERRYLTLEGAATPWGGYLRQFYFRSASPLARGELVVVVPKGATVWTHSYHGAPQPEIFRDGEQSYYYFRADQVPPLEPEPGAVPRDEYLPYVIVAVDLPPAQALLTNGLVLERSLQTSYSVAETAAELCRHADSDAQKVREIFGFVTREISIGDTREPGAVLATRRGQRSGLFTSLLRAVGIPAELALARAGSDAVVAPPFPDASRYNTPVVRAKLADGQSLWAVLDDKHPWLGQLPPELKDGEYAIFDGQQLGRSYELTAGDIDSWPIDSSVDLEVNAEGTAVGTVAVRLPGAFGSEIRDFLLTARAEDVQRQMQTWVGALVPGAILLKFGTEGRDEPLEPLLLRAEVRIEQFLVKDQGRLIAEQFFSAPLGLQSLGLPTLGAYVRLPRRDSPLLIHELAEHMEVRVRLPVDTEPPVETPAAFLRQAAYGQFAQQFSYDRARREASLVIDQRMPLLRLQPEALPAFLAGAQEILQTSRNRLVVPLQAPGPRNKP